MLKRLVVLLLLGLCFAGSAFAAGNPTAVIETNLGVIKLELFQKEAPISVQNFIEYAKSGHYNGTIFHRVIPGFMVQGGGLTQELSPKPNRAPIKNEATNGLKNERGTVAMARTGVVDSATSQFFINVVNNEFLNHRGVNPMAYGYAVFGKVVSGMDVVDKIAATPTGMQKGFQDVPTTPVIIKSVKIQ
jgi:peptidyl-prolyl cis-trans isomerase A (cyclophilin A)